MDREQGPILTADDLPACVTAAETATCVSTLILEPDLNDACEPADRPVGNPAAAPPESDCAKTIATPGGLVLAGGELQPAPASGSDTLSETTEIESFPGDPTRPHEIVPAQVVEALLFSADAPLSLSRLADLAEISAKEARLLIAELNDKYRDHGLSFRIEEIARGYQMMTEPRFQPWIARLNKQQAQTRLTAAGLETLSIVAYKQPVIRADIEAIRGVASGEVLNRLREMGLVKIIGRAEIVGRPLLYGTTKRFLDIFGLADLNDLPPMETLTLRRLPVAAPGPQPVDPGNPDVSAGPGEPPRRRISPADDTGPTALAAGA